MIIFLRPDNLTSRLDPCMMVVLWIGESIRVENYSRERFFCFVTKFSRKLVYNYKSVVDTLCQCFPGRRVLKKVATPMGQSLCRSTTGIVCHVMKGFGEASL